MGCEGSIVLRACCRTAAACGRRVGFVESESNPNSIATEGAPVLARNVAPLVSPAVAAHEAGHSVVGLLLGADVPFARIGVSASAGIVFEENAPRRHRAAAFLAGPIAENWSARWVIRQSDADLKWYRDRIREVDLGNCDWCRAMFWTIAENTRLDETAAFTRYREMEAQTIEVVRRRDVWRSIRRVADALLEHGALDGERIKALVDCEPINIS